MGSWLERLYGAYDGAHQWEARWRDWASRVGAREKVAGQSVQGRPLWRFDWGRPGAGGPTVLLTALIHGIELIGSVTLLGVLERLARDARRRALLETAHLVMLPVMNPDALALNMDRLRRGLPAARRTNRRGVDLNRNFPPVGARPCRHPFAGSRFRGSPHYRGPYPLSEPESLALYQVAREVRPQLSIGFHSFGNMLLFPWAHSRAANPRWPAYRGLAKRFFQALPRGGYTCKQAFDFYPTSGDLDDWLDATFGTAAFTLEVSALDGRLWHPLRLLNPFCWMNPTRVEETVEQVVPGVLDLLAAPSPAAVGGVAGLTGVRQLG